MPMSPPGDRAGFTLLELVVVLILLGAVALVAIPTFSRGLTGIRLETATRDLITHMRQARMQAVATQRVHRILLLPAETPESPSSYAVTDEFERPLKRIDLPERVHPVLDDASPRLISFYPNGRSSGGFVVLRAEGGRRTTVEVSPITGFGRMIPVGESGS